MFSLAFLGGALADYLDKRRMLRFTEVGQTFVTLILLVNSLQSTPQIWVLFVAVALHAGLAALQRPAFESFIQKVIPTLRGVGIADAKHKLQIDRYSAISKQGAKVSFLDAAKTFDGWKVASLGKFGVESPEDLDYSEGVLCYGLREVPTRGRDRADDADRALFGF